MIKVFWRYVLLSVTNLSVKAEISAGTKNDKNEEWLWRISRRSQSQGFRFDIDAASKKFTLLVVSKDTMPFKK